MRFLFSFIIACACALAFFPQAALSAVDIIDGIKVDVEADSALAAKEKALAQARTKALHEWCKKRGINPTSFNPKTLESAAVFIDVVEEKMAGRHYGGTFKVGIEPRVLNSSAEATATYQHASFQPSAPTHSGSGSWILVVPVHRTAQGPSVWDEADPWAQAWRAPIQRSHTDFLVTGGDIDDKKTLSDWAAATADQQAMADLAGKYKAEGVALVTLDTAFSDHQDREGIVEVAVWTPARGVMVMRSPVNDPSLIPQARQQALTLLDQLTKDGNAFLPQPPVSPSAYGGARMVGLPYAPPTMIEVPLKAKLYSPHRWMEIRYTLATIPGLVIKPLRVTSDQADIIVRYPGTREQLLQELKKRGLTS